MVYCVHSNKQSYAHSLENITRSSPTKHPEVLIMPTVFDSPIPDKATEQDGVAAIDPADITQLRTAVQTDAQTAPQAYIDLIDSRTVEVPLAEWRRLMRTVSYLADRRSFHRNYGADLVAEGVLIEVIR
jgi:hypothetical protein